MSEFKFYLPRNENVRGAENPYLTGTLIDQRSHFIIKLAVTSGFGAKFTSALVTIAKQNATTNETAVSFPVLIGANVVIQVPPVGTPATGKLEVPFVDNTRYTIKLTANAKDGYGDEQQYFAEYITIGDVTVPSYSFLYRADGGDKFKTEEVAIVNESSVEGAVGSNIVVRCPINRVNVNDTTIPRELTFTFDATDNLESVSYSKKLPYNASGDYTLDQTTSKKLYNDKAYKISVIAIYKDGYYTSITFPKVLHVIANPVIHSITAYGLTTDQSDADALEISSVMNVSMNNQTGQTNLPPKSGKITFELSQVVNAIRVVMYNAVMDISTVVSSEGTILYTILKNDLVKVWTTTAPTQETNGSYKYDVSAKIEHSTVYALVTIFKQSAALNKTFTSDIVPLPSVVALNAWIAGANVEASGNRTVDIINATTASGYALAPELGIVGKFSKNDFYGSGVTAGFFKDLDTVNTNHAFAVIVNGTTKVVPVLHQLQGYGTKTDQEMYIELFGLTGTANGNGLFPNIPGPAGVLGIQQKPIYFWIPNTNNLFKQSDSVKVSIAIQPTTGETTRPAATESAAQVIVAKINKYEMVAGQASEVKFSGSGETATLTVPINNAKTQANELYFSSAIFTSNLSAPNDTKEVAVSNNGVFDISVVNPSKRGEGASNACVMQVRYKIADPNGGTITGPISSDYTLNLMDNPLSDNFTVSNYSYETFNDNAASKIKFDITFQTVETRSIDGVYVYFRSTNNDAVTENDITLTLLKDVKRSAGDSQLNLTHTLQSDAPADAALASGIKIKDKDGADSVKSWLNFRSGEIVFKPYYTLALLSDTTPTIVDTETVKTVYNIPKIPMPTNLTLTGGVKESHTATMAAWSDALSTYASIGSSVTASYKLVKTILVEVNNIMVPVEIEVPAANHGYTIDLSSVAADTLQTLKLQTRITASDNTIYLSDTAELKFTVASVFVTGLTSTVKRGSNDTVLRVSRGDYTITPASGANVTEVKLIDNPTVATVVNTNPEAATVKVLTSTAAAVQPVGPAINEYNLVATGNAYALGDDLDLQYRLKAGVDYTTKYGVAASPSTTSSTPLFLTLASQTLKYIVATKPDLQLESTYTVMSSGAYSGRIAINATINAKGLHAEGVVSVVFVLAQEGNFTNPDLSDSGVQYVIAFESVTGLTKSYTVGSNASLVPSSTDNLGATEVHELSVTDVAGFAEGGAGARTLVMGNLLAGDASTLYLAASGFDTSRPITAVSVVGTRLGNDIAFRELGPSAILSNFSVTNKVVGGASFALTAPTTNSAGAFTYTSSNLAVATVSGSTVTLVGAGSTTITATQAATATYASNSISASLVVMTLLSLDSNGVTIKYNGNAADVPASSALFIQADPRGTGSEWFAVVKDGMKSAITTYAAGGSSTPFIPPGQGQTAVPFNNIVTTLMTDMTMMFFGNGNFNQAIQSWDTSNVIFMINMFYGATAFNQNISGWNVDFVINYVGFSTGSALIPDNTPSKFRPIVS